jgi:hypothetical protein
MFRRMFTGLGFPVIAQFGLLLVCGPANADTQASQRSHQGASRPSPFGSSSPYDYPPAFVRKWCATVATSTKPCPSTIGKRLRL